MQKNHWGKDARYQRFRRLLILMLIFSFSVSMTVIIDQRIQPIVEMIAKQRAHVTASRIVNAAVREQIAGGLSYDDLVAIHKDIDGNIVLLQSDSVRISDISTSVAQNIEKNLSAAGQQGISIPSGLLSGLTLLANVGPKINVTFQPIGEISVIAEDQFVSIGINQSKHRIVLHSKVDVSLILPFAKEVVTVENTVPLAETIIVGPVPQTYLNLAK